MSNNEHRPQTGMRQARGINAKKVTLTLPREVIEEADALADLEGITRSFFFARAVREQIRQAAS